MAKDWASSVDPAWLARHFPKDAAALKAKATKNLTKKGQSAKSSASKLTAADHAENRRMFRAEVATPKRGGKGGGGRQRRDSKGRFA